jgi:hypothetical protein
MMEIIYITLFAAIGIFLYNLYLIFKPHNSETPTDALNKWKTSMLLFIIALLVFFVYSGTTFSLIAQTQTITDGVDTFTYTNNNFLAALSFSPLMNAIILVDFFFLVAHIFMEFKVFGRGRMPKRHRQGY